LSFLPLLILDSLYSTTIIGTPEVYTPVFLSMSSNYLPRRTDSLNAAQQKPVSHAMFGAVEEEMHDAKRVEKYGQEDGLRYAMEMVIRRDKDLASLYLSRSIPVWFFFTRYL
jgi:hypothetical protein